MANRLLKDLAMSAKNRLINRQNGDVNKRTYYNPNIKFKIISNEDIDFYEKVKNLSDEDLVTPLKKLINDEYFSSLSRQAQERYLLQTIDKYTKFREKIRLERDKTAL